MVEIKVCVGSACHVRGSYNVLQSFQQLIEEKGLHGKVEIKAAFCVKECQKDGVSVTVEEKNHNVKPEEARRFFRDVIVPLVQ